MNNINDNIDTSLGEKFSDRLKKFINMQYVKIKRTAAVGSLIILALNLSFSIYPFIEHRNIHPYLAIPLVFIFVVFFLWMAAHLYVKKLEMYKTESLADRIFNPYSVYAIGPFEEMKYRNIDLVIMKYIFELLPEGKQKNDLKDQIDKVTHWCNLGYIPKKDFPQHLRKYYITNNEMRL
jgi:hypothetical protein